MIHRIQAIRLTDYQKLDYQIIKMQNYIKRLPKFRLSDKQRLKRFCNEHEQVPACSPSPPTLQLNHHDDCSPAKKALQWTSGQPDGYLVDTSA